jgi:hypothetical protein
MKELPSVLYRFTTNLNKFAVAGTESVPGTEDTLLADSDTVDFWNYYDNEDNPQAISLLRFHLVVIHPGDTHTWHDGYTSWSEDAPYSANDGDVPTLGALKENVDKCCWENFAFDTGTWEGTAPGCTYFGVTLPSDYCFELLPGFEYPVDTPVDGTNFI